MELRGALEDKIHRHRLLGLDEHAALTTALRDFGSASAVARDLNAVHTLPTVYRGLLLAGIGTLLGWQAVAQVPMVRAIPDPQELAQTCQHDEAMLSRMSLSDAAALRLKLAQPGARAKLEADCRAMIPAPVNTLLSLADLLAALRKGGIIVNTIPGFDGYLQLTFPGRKDIQGLDLSGSTKMIGGQAYLQAAPLVSLLRHMLPSDVTLRLSGIDNPVLEIGPARVQLGTAATPVKATDFYLFLLLEVVETQLKNLSQTSVELAFVFDNNDPQSPKLKLGAPDQALFATISNARLVAKSNATAKEYYLLRVRAVSGGLLAAPKGRIVNTPAELIAATAKGQEALLVYRLNAADLRNLKLTPVPAKSLQPVP
ncbi:hypothetical protein SU48_12360 [Deinococcus puniceus]|uniref:Uncharacterized protein n=1 Tax=Deinococcus puniceus TaxID=1182568 RepID=A0A172TC90_9DEIO|nr:hypothetical protein SU48_12360 [Deinococcus puniceus]